MILPIGNLRKTTDIPREGTTTTKVVIEFKRAFKSSTPRNNEQYQK